jgi:hypothetical protein
LIQLIRGYAIERDFVTADADLSPERRLYGSSGSGVATYKELIKNMASKAAPDGGALPKIIAKWIDTLKAELLSQGISLSDESFMDRLNLLAAEKLREIEYMVGGFDFAKVIAEYYRAYVDGNDDKRSACLRWLRGEFATKTEARSQLGFQVSVIIDDENWYDFIKLWAVLIRFMGYRGFIVFIDECVNLYKINHRISRENNYEKILSMFNDTLQGRATGLGLILGGTPQFMDDTRRGLFSYDALKSRLSDSRFTSSSYKNLLGPVIRLKRLNDEELFALIARITKLYEANYGIEVNISTDEMVRFLELSLSRAGADSMITPREILRDYMTVLNILMQNEDASFDDIIKDIGAVDTVATNVASDSSGNENNVNVDASPSYKAEDIEF